MKYRGGENRARSQEKKMFKRITPKELRIQKRVEREKMIVNPGVVEIVARRKSIFSRKLERTQKRESGAKWGQW